MRTDEELYDELIQAVGKPAHTTYPTDAQLDKWRGRLPDLLLRYWQEQGWGSLGEGKYWVCDPDQLRPVMEEVFQEDPEFKPDDLIPIGYNALGMIDVYMGAKRTMSVDLVFGTVTWRDESLASEDVPASEFLGCVNTIG